MNILDGCRDLPFPADPGNIFSLLCMESVFGLANQCNFLSCYHFSLSLYRLKFSTQHSSLNTSLWCSFSSVQITDFYASPCGTNLLTYYRLTSIKWVSLVTTLSSFNTVLSHHTAHLTLLKPSPADCLVTVSCRHWLSCDSNGTRNGVRKSLTTYTARRLYRICYRSQLLEKFVGKWLIVSLQW